MKIHPKFIGFDIDGVVADTMEAFIRLADEEYETVVVPEEITEFQVEDCLDMDPVVVDEIFCRLLIEPVKSGLKMMAGAKAVLTEFAQHGPITLITARPQREPIADWLAEQLGAEVFERVRLVATGEHDGKGNYIKEMGLKYFVDDRAQTCLQLSIDSRISPIVYHQPWNHGKHDLPKVENWPAIRSLCFGS